MTEHEVPEGIEDGLGDEVEEAMRRHNRRNRRGHTIISPDLIARLLDLPEGSEVTGIFTDYRVNGLIVSFVSDDLPEIDPLVESSRVESDGHLRMMPAPPFDPDEPQQAPGEGDLLYARINLHFPQMKDATA